MPGMSLGAESGFAFPRPALRDGLLSGVLHGSLLAAALWVLILRLSGVI